MTLDQRIIKDFTERLAGNPIFEAKRLASLAKMKQGNTLGFSTLGMPRYYCGNRKEKTVFVQLNPGIDASLADNLWCSNTKHFNKSSILTFINDYENDRKNYGRNDRMRYDSFDVKQAAFLFDWPNSGIPFKQPADWGNRAFCLYAKEQVLMNKLQLELIPYASSKFDIDKKSINLLYPFVDTLLDEIFKIDREYVIFGSAIFEYIFEKYNKECSHVFNLSKSKASFSGLWSKSSSCKVIEINYKGKKQKALIAHTFPCQALGKAFCIMQQYGKRCYEEFIKTTFP